MAALGAERRDVIAFRRVSDPETREGVNTTAEGVTDVLGPGTHVLGPGTDVLGPGTDVLGPGTHVLGPGTHVLGPGTHVLGPGTDVLGPLTDSGLPTSVSRLKSEEELELVIELDDKLCLCFQHDAPDDVTTEEDPLLQKDDIWTSVTQHDGQVTPVDWNHSRTCSLHQVFKLGEKQAASDVTMELSDQEEEEEEELREQLDLHSIIVSCLDQEPLFTAEQVIEEIEEMMQACPDGEEEQNRSHSDSTSSHLSCSYEERLRTLSVAELSELLEETEAAIGRFSEELVRALALRDELEFEKEVTNGFISALIDVQNRQKEQREAMKRRKRRSGAGPERPPGSYLTTVIPYEKRGGPPSLEDLQVLTKILQAMKDGSDKVPGLLTDYILKVLCPK